MKYCVVCQNEQYLKFKEEKTFKVLVKNYWLITFFTFSITVPSVTLLKTIFPPSTSVNVKTSFLIV